MGIYDTIRARMKELTAAEKTFAEYVLKTDDLVFKTITVVTEESGAGYGTIVRFCQKLGFSGFQDFKIRLAVESSPDPAPQDSAEWLGAQAERRSQQLKSTGELISEELLTQVAAAVAGARLTLIVAVAGSFPVAQDLGYRLDRMGLPCRTEADTHLQAICASLLRPADVLFAVSSSGSTKELLEVAQLARQRGATVIALTNSAKSPLAEQADLVISTGVYEGALQAELGTKLPFFFVVEVLSALLLKTVPDAEANLKTSAASVTGRAL